MPPKKTRITLLIKRGGLRLKTADVGQLPVKDKIVYTNLSQTLWLSQTLKPEGYEFVNLPYDYYCPSVQAKLKKNGGERYQCKLSTCRKICTTLALAQKHIMLSGHSQMIMDQNQPPADNEDLDNEENTASEVEPDNDRAIIIPTGEICTFLRSEFVADDQPE